MADPEPFTTDEMFRLAGSGVAKIDLLGARGTTLCTAREIEAMASLLVTSGALVAPGIQQRLKPIFPQIEKDRS